MKTQAIPKTNQNRAFPPIKTLTTKSETGQYGIQDAPIAKELDHYLLGVGAINAKDVEQPRSKFKNDSSDRSLKSDLTERIPSMAADFLGTQASKAVSSFKKAFHMRPTHRLVRAMKRTPQSQFGQVATKAIASRGSSPANRMGPRAEFSSSFRLPSIRGFKKALASSEIVSSEIPSKDSSAPVTDDSEMPLAAGMLPPESEGHDPPVKVWGGS